MVMHKCMPYLNSLQPRTGTVWGGAFIMLAGRHMLPRATSVQTRSTVVRFRQDERTITTTLAPDTRGSYTREAVLYSPRLPTEGTWSVSVSFNGGFDWTNQVHYAVWSDWGQR